MIKVQECGNLSLSQLAKLLGEIDAVAKLEDDELAEANATEIREFIDMLMAFGFIDSGKRSRYLMGLETSLKRRGKKNA